MSLRNKFVGYLRMAQPSEAAMKDRIIKHMNADHQDSVRVHRDTSGLTSTGSEICRTAVFLPENTLVNRSSHRHHDDLHHSQDRLSPEAVQLPALLPSADV
jgi:Protein of unknown function (DUF2470)